MPYYAIDGVRPVVDPSAFVHPTATVIGDVFIGPGCYVGPGAVLRGDFGRLVLEAGCNLQDTCVMHGFPGGETVVEENGHVGHGAVLHGCRVGRDALVGMNSVVMDEAVIGAGAILAAMSFVGAGSVVPAGALAVGSPARVKRQLTDSERRWKREGTRAYQDLARRSLDSLREVEPLRAAEPGRPALRIPPGLDPLHRTPRD